MFNPDQDPLSSLEERLRSWVPAAGGLDRDRMLFEAGRADVQGTVPAGTVARLWRYATAAAVMLASGLGMAWQNERSQRRVLELSSARLAPPAPLLSTPELITERQEKAAPVDPMSYLGLVRQVKCLEDAASLEPHLAPPRASGQPTRLEPYPCDPAIGIG